MTDIEIVKANLRKALARRKTGLVWYYRVGRCVLALTEASGYGSECVDEAAAQKLGLCRSSLFRAAQLVQKYPGKEFAAIKNLSWSVAKALLTIKDAKLRRELQARANKEGWPSRNLKRIINERQGKIEPRGGHKRQRKSAGEDLVRLAAVTREWRLFVTAIWPVERLRKLQPNGVKLATVVGRVSRAMGPLVQMLKVRALPV
jgi:hypothetical protein